MQLKGKTYGNKRIIVTWGRSSGKEAHNKRNYLPYQNKTYNSNNIIQQAIIKCLPRIKGHIS